MVEERRFSRGPLYQGSRLARCWQGGMAVSLMLACWGGLAPRKGDRRKQFLPAGGLRAGEAGAHKKAVECFRFALELTADFAGMLSASSFCLAALVFAFGHRKQLGELDVVDVGDGLEGLEGWVLGPVLDLIHVRVVAADLCCNVLVGHLPLNPQVGNDRSQRLCRGVCLALERSNGTAHPGIIDS